MTNRHSAAQFPFFSFFRFIPRSSEPAPFEFPGTQTPIDSLLQSSPTINSALANVVSAASPCHVPLTKCLRQLGHRVKTDRLLDGAVIMARSHDGRSMF